MPTARYVKVKLRRLLSGRGLLLLVPLVWICLLLWSARTADTSARSSLHLHRSQRSFAPKSGHSNSREGHHLQRISVRKRHRQDEEVDDKGRALKQSHSVASGTLSNLALLKKIGFLGGVKARFPPKKQQVRIIIIVYGS